MTRYILGLVLMSALAPSTLCAQALSDLQRETIRQEIQAIQDVRNRAFVEGDCLQVIGQFDEGVTFYTQGRQVPSLQALFNFCQQVERPFPETAVRTTRINVLSETSAYIVQNFEFPGTGADGQTMTMREIITSIWSKGTEGWKIVHFHVSIDPIRADPAAG